MKEVVPPVPSQTETVAVAKPNKESRKAKPVSNMSQLASSMAEKLKDKPRKKHKADPSVSDVNYSDATSTSPKQPMMSTVSVSPQKRAEALKPTDDSMSMAMGPQGT